IFDEVPICRADTRVEGVICRVLCPRRLSLRTKMSTRVTAESEYIPRIPQQCEAQGTEMKIATIQTAGFVRGGARDLTASVDVAPSGEVLSCSAYVGSISCAAVSSAECRCRGGITVCVLSKESGGGISEKVTKLEFDETVMLDGETQSGTSAAASGVITSAEVREDAAGAHIEVTYSLTVECASRTEAAVTADAYNCNVPTAAEYGDAAYLSLISPISGSISVSEGTGIKSGTDAEVIFADAEVGDATYDNGRVRLEGRVTGSVLQRNADSGAYEVQSFSLPWRFDAGAEHINAGVGGEIYFRGSANVVSVSCRTGGGDLEVDAEVSVSGFAMETCRERVLESLELLPNDAEPCRRGIVVYYPDRDEGIWDVAKKFRVPTSAVASGENVTDGKLNRVVVI
ncbi:MAG: hypothetical protein LUH54_04290, partial [Firmicutes bacterium]|nr:hypothetical protein [Bacillota bacterium]